MPKRQLQPIEPHAPKTVDQVQFESDRDAFLRVKQAEREKQAPKRADVRAAQRYERERDQRTALKFMAAVEQKHLREWAGVQTKQIHEFSDRYGLPCRGPTFSVPQVMHWLFRFLGRYGRHLLRAENDADPMLVGPGSPKLEEYRGEAVLMQRLKRLALERTLIPIRLVQDGLRESGAPLRTALERLKRECPPRAFEIVSEALDDSDAALRRFLQRLAAEEEPYDLRAGSPESNGDGQGPEAPLDA